MVYYNKTKASEGIDLNKSNRSKECINCYYWYDLDNNYTYQPEECDACHDTSMIAYELENISILNIKDVDYRRIIWNISKSEAVNKMNYSTLENQGSL